MTRTWLCAALLAASILAAGCSSSRAGHGPVDTDRVEMPRSYRFAPETIRVVAGTTVTWHNGDNFTHSVYIEETEQLRGPIKPGESASLTFAEPGEYHYVCSYHAQQMKGTVIVTAP